MQEEEEKNRKEKHFVDSVLTFSITSIKETRKTWRPSESTQSDISKMACSELLFNPSMSTS